jgi:hypothetical protein
MRSGLRKLGHVMDDAQERSRRQAAKVLREGGEELERLERQGERGWKELDAGARRRLRSLFQRLDKALESKPGPKKPPARKTTRKVVRKTKRTMQRAAERVEP